MPKITKIENKADKQRYYIHIDDKYCTSVRHRTFPALNLFVGKEITCDGVKELDNYYFKHAYGTEAWEKEKVRLNNVKGLIESLNPFVKVNIVGFGADTNEFIGRHPGESGKPDFEVVTKGSDIPLLLVEVTGTEFMRESNYWVRPDKLEYARNHPDQEVWVILHYVHPVEKYIFIKPNLSAEYLVANKDIGGAIEHYVEFTDDSPEVVSQAAFAEHLNRKISELSG